MKRIFFISFLCLFGISVLSGCNKALDLFLPEINGAKQSPSASEQTANAMTKDQRIEITSIEDGHVLYTITSREDIKDFTEKQRVEESEYVPIPDDAEQLCRIVYWQEPTKTVIDPPEQGEMNILSTSTLYRNENGYYVYQRLVTMNMDLSAKIADEAGEYLESLLRAGGEK